MDRRIMAVACIIAILILSGVFLLSRPITGTWVCTEPLTQSAILTDEITVITIQPDGVAGFRTYATYLVGRYTIRQGNGQWEPLGSGTYHIAIMQGYDTSCTQFMNCTTSTLVPFGFTVQHDRIRDTILYTDDGTPQFSGRWPFVRSVGRDCSGPEGCTGY